MASVQPNGEARLRVTTVTRKWSDGANVGELIGGFDQEAAAVALARLVGWKVRRGEELSALTPPLDAGRRV